MSKTKMQLSTFQILAIFGILIFLIGLFAVFYSETHQTVYHALEDWEIHGSHTVYPYQNIGITLTIVGILLTVSGLILHERKTT